MNTDSMNCVVRQTWGGLTRALPKGVCFLMEPKKSRKVNHRLAGAGFDCTAEAAMPCLAVGPSHPHPTPPAVRNRIPTWQVLRGNQKRLCLFTLHARQAWRFTTRSPLQKCDVTDPFAGNRLQVPVHSVAHWVKDINTGYKTLVNTNGAMDR